jgi:AraC family transcriptional regulator
MDSDARISREEWHSRLLLEERWPDYKQLPVAAAGDSWDDPRLLDDQTDPADWTAGSQGFPTRPSATEHISKGAELGLFGWAANSRSQDDRHEGASAHQLLDDIRLAMEESPEATLAAVLRLVKLVTPPTVAEPASARGGLAPWQKRKVDRYLKQNLDRQVRVNTVAGHVALSVSYFSRAFKKSFGVTPHMHMLRLRLKLAQQLMLTTEEPLSQIALACGLADQAHLSKLFRRLVGDTPGAWRRQNLTDAQVQARSHRSRRGQSTRPVSCSGSFQAA